MEHYEKQTQEELIEQQHNNYINKVTESGMPLWYYDSLYSSLPLYEYEELKENRISVNTASHDQEDSLPF